MVAATTAIPATGIPDASRARWASRAVDPVVSTSSHTTARSRCPASRRTWRRRAAHGSGEVLGPAHGVEPGLVHHPAAGLEQPRGRDGVAPAVAAAGRRTGSSPTSGRARGCGSCPGATAPAPAPRAAARRTPRPTWPRRRAERAGEGQHAALLVGDHHGPDGAVVRRGGERWRQPVGGRGRPGGARPVRQAGRAGRAQGPPAPAAADTAAAEDEVGEGVAHPAMPAGPGPSLKSAHARLWTTVSRRTRRGSSRRPARPGRHHREGPAGWCS